VYEHVHTFDSFLSCTQVTGIEGNFRVTCNSVMRVLRENKDSLMAVLEAFVYDPLLNWRLIDSMSSTEAHKYSETSFIGPPSESKILVPVMKP